MLIQYLFEFLLKFIRRCRSSQEANPKSLNFIKLRSQLNKNKIKIQTRIWHEITDKAANSVLLNKLMDQLPMPLYSKQFLAKIYSLALVQFSNQLVFHFEIKYGKQPHIRV